ncbi:MAG: creatininase family protein [Planctomycetota bacterium]|nr:MAG: creatininase family protein [Planctomycetota bacterium]
MRPWVLAETNYGQVKNIAYEVAVLPLGATEPHNLHLPYGMDTFEGNVIGEHICRAAWEQGAKVILLPTIPYGTQTNQRAFPFSLNLNPTTLYVVLADLVASLEHQGIRKIVLLNSHGGNDLKGFLREMYGRIDARLFLCNWYTIFRDVYDQIFENPDDHAGEMETSLALAYWPDLVARNEDGSLAADEGAKRPSRFRAVEEGWVSITRPWHLLTTNAGAGNPHKASADKGRRLMEVLVERLGTFLVELAESPLDDQFPFAELPDR